MKRIYISILLLLISVTASFAEIGYISRSAEEYSQKIEEIDTLMLKNDFNSALSLCEEIDRNWDDTAKKIDVLLIHDYVDSIGLSISQMRAHIENNSPDMYFAESANAKKGLASIKGSEYPFFENIL